MWNSIVAGNRTWVRFKSRFQGSYLDREELKQTAGVAGYKSANNVKHGDMEDTFMHLESATSEKGA